MEGGEVEGEAVEGEAGLGAAAEEAGGEAGEATGRRSPDRWSTQTIRFR